MSEREQILGRIREALTVPAPKPVGHSGASPAKTAGAAAEQIRRWLPPGGNTFEEQLARFAANSLELKAALYPVSDAAELNRRLIELRDAEGWKKVATHSGALTDGACGALQLPVCKTDQPYDRNELETCDAAITECDGLVAQTGSVLVTSHSTGGRAISVLPPHHVVLARREQLIRDLPAAFELLKTKYAANYPSMISFITGPSRTGDIERILVLGAHGPKQLTIFLVGN